MKCLIFSPIVTDALFKDNFTILVIRLQLLLTCFVGQSLIPKCMKFFIYLIESPLKIVEATIYMDYYLLHDNRNTITVLLVLNINNS